MALSILVVDDEASIAETLAELLSWDGHVVTTASNGEDALAKMAMHRPDLVILDFMMPIKDGVQTLAEMRQTPSLADIPVIMVTAAPRAVPKDAGYDVILTKPFDLPTLRAKVKALVPDGG